MKTSDQPGTNLAIGLGVMFATSVVIGILWIAQAPFWLGLIVSLVWLIGGLMAVLSIADVLNRVSRK